MSYGPSHVAQSSGGSYSRSPALLHRRALPRRHVLCTRTHVYTRPAISKQRRKHEARGVTRVNPQRGDASNRSRGTSTGCRFVSGYRILLFSFPFFVLALISSTIKTAFLPPSRLEFWTKPRAASLVLSNVSRMNRPREKISFSARRYLRSRERLRRSHEIGSSVVRNFAENTPMPSTLARATVALAFDVWIRLRLPGIRRTKRCDPRGCTACTREDERTGGDKGRRGGE